MEEIACIFCGKINAAIVIEENGYTGRECAECGLIYISPRPSLTEVLGLYQQNAAYVSAEAHISSGFAKRLYARHNLKIITSLVKSGAVLEIGAGAGYFLDEARKIGFDPYGIEFNPIQANFIRNELKIPCEESPLSASSFEGQSFAVIYHCDVVSHFFDPISEFETMRQRISEGGFLIFETGNLAEVNRKYYRYFPRFQYPDHLFFFSLNSVKMLLEKTGFEFVAVYRYSILPQLWLRQALLSGKRLVFGARPSSGGDDTAHSAQVGTSGRNAVAPASTDMSAAARKFARIGYSTLNYLIRYKIGRIVPKAQRPQTMIVIARKRE